MVGFNTSVKKPIKEFNLQELLTRFMDGPLTPQDLCTVTGPSIA